MDILVSDQEYQHIISRLQELETVDKTQQFDTEKRLLAEGLHGAFAIAVESLKNIYRVCDYLTGGDIPYVQLDIYERVKSEYKSEDAFREDFYSFLRESIKFPSAMWALTPYFIRFKEQQTFVAFKKELIETAEKHFPILDNLQTDSIIERYFDNPTKELEQLKKEQHCFNDLYFDRAMHFYFFELKQEVEKRKDTQGLDELSNRASYSIAEILFVGDGFPLAPTEEQRRKYQQYCLSLYHSIEYRKKTIKVRHRERQGSRPTEYKPTAFEELFIPPHHEHVDKYLAILKLYIPFEKGRWNIEHRGYVRAFYDKLIEIEVIYHYEKRSNNNLKYVSKQIASPIFHRKFGVGENILYANKSEKKIVTNIEDLRNRLEAKKAEIINNLNY